ncbi:ThiJ/PfpI family protein [Formosa agariphila KMM 3901]|uniref:ThiJ/PfpI family protein n=1 Tax=Formosa agariphila (strain DSM 15362 / KCTC 12365 / LMG 23005 / KMM 3901 / M-2Alg 35-1) TaxID=1347342 RepID=T2KQQ7_FORAG|nr:type 1 glutamine amidotransferase domain-containing protein [Formosa agariphila]CDF80786.1 ThiJ/PfpI family protein [Formosa agariphila KMM 3901]
MKKILFIVAIIVVTACQTKVKKVNKDVQTIKESKKVLFVVTSHEELGETGNKTGYWLSEVSHVWHILSKEGFEIDFVSPDGGEAPIDPTSMDTNDSINIAFLENNKYQQKIKNTFKPIEVNPKDYSAIYFAGGHGTMWDFADNEKLENITATIYENGGLVSAVCHGPSGLVNVKLRNGKNLLEGISVSGFTNEEESEIELTDVVPFSLEDALINSGAKMNKAGLWQEQVTVDSRIITGQNPQSASAVGRMLLKKLEK